MPALAGAPRSTFDASVGGPAVRPTPGEKGAALRMLTLSSLFPSAARPRHGIFVETRLRHLIRHHAVEARVVAPVPWFPFKSPLFGAYSSYAKTPARELRDEGRIPVAYPRYPMIPRLGVARQPERIAHAAARCLKIWAEAGWEPQLIDAHYLYPDGVAAGLLAEALRIPFVMTARGTDVNVIAQLPQPGARILWAAERAACVITVADRLRDGLLSLGVPRGKVVTIRNGVDLDVFRIADPHEARAQLGLPDGPLLGAVGNLVPEKDQALAIAALEHLPKHRLVIVGDGPQRWALQSLAQRLGVADRVSIRPAMPQADLAGLYASLDALLLTSTREGWPNVVLEALACGTPVVATDVGAVKEIFGSGGVGCIVRQRTPAAVAAAVASAIADRRPPEALRQHAARFDWASVSHAQLTLFIRALHVQPPDR